MRDTKDGRFISNLFMENISIFTKMCEGRQIKIAIEQFNKEIKKYLINCYGNLPIFCDFQKEF